MSIVLEFVVDFLILLVLFFTGFFLVLKSDFVANYMIKRRKESFIYNNLPVLGKHYQQETVNMETNKKGYKLFYQAIGIFFILFGLFIVVDIYISHRANFS